MFKYKSSWCPDRHESHDSKNCIYAHHMRDFRRPPAYFDYSPEDCEHIQGNINVTMCPNGLLCNKAHTAIEKLYHPESYKRKNCEKFKCNKKEICAFNHNASEKNHATKMAKKFVKKNAQFKIDTHRLNITYLDHYMKPNYLEPPQSKQQQKMNPLLDQQEYVKKLDNYKIETDYIKLKSDTDS